MKHLHKRFTLEQIKLLFSAYLKKRVSREDVQQELGIGKSRLFALLAQYRKNPDAFSIAYHRQTSTRISSQTEQAIAEGLQFDKQLIADPNVPITIYNYSALKDRIREKHALTVSLPTIINRAKALDCYQQKRPRTSHDREVITTAIGVIVQGSSTQPQ